MRLVFSKARHDFCVIYSLGIHRNKNEKQKHFLFKLLDFLIGAIKITVCSRFVLLAFRFISLLFPQKLKGERRQSIPGMP